MTDTVAAIDCGTNSTRLLIADRAGRTLDRRMVITRLGQGVDAQRRLSPAGVERTIETLRSYRKAMDAHGVGAARLVATSAARDAADRDEFFDAARQVTGVTPELLAGDEEGRLSFAGATAGLPVGQGPFLVVDIGGGSTELVVGEATVKAVWSADVGCVRVSERFLQKDPPAGPELERARAHVSTVLAAAVEAMGGLAGARTLVGLAGTVSTAAMVDLGLERYDRERVHHHRLTAPVVAGILHELAALPLEERARRPGVEPGRADVIVGGLVVLDAVLADLGFAECLVSESDILDGLVMSLLDR
ncbi:MAG TPA: Ppx/GppA phosphatase family protein [Acidimicrobiales bacterium]|nr:Ppx/GppA phosphatase family protein [Acidimicrobiales bacterium]